MCKQFVLKSKFKKSQKRLLKEFCPRLQVLHGSFGEKMHIDSALTIRHRKRIVVKACHISGVFVENSFSFPPILFFQLSKEDRQKYIGFARIVPVFGIRNPLETKEIK